MRRDWFSLPGSAWRLWASRSACPHRRPFSRWWRAIFAGAGLLFAWQTLQAEHWYTQGKWSNRFPAAQTAAHLGPHLAHVQKLPGDIVLEFGDNLPPDMAIAVLTAALATDPYASDLIGALARTQYRAGNRSTAAELAARAAELSPHSREIQALARAYAVERDWMETR